MNGRFVEINGLRMWYGEQGEGEPLVMLHPGGVGAIAFAPNLNAMASQFRVLLPERRGHGRTPDVEGPYSYDLLADDTVRFLDEVVGGPAHLLGMSDGAIVALLTALKRPDLVQRLICVAGVFHNSGWAPGVVEPLADAEGFEKKLNEMHLGGPRLAPGDLKNVRCRTLVMIGDDDEVRLEHAIAFYQSLPNGELAIVPGTSHGLLVEKPDLCNQILLDLLTRDAVPTVAPRLRQGAGAPAS